MSMLAEFQRKKKWSVDPQGKRWSKDNDKIGQKMLEKMGWTNGKGLGINEQGVTEHVRINKRNFENKKAGIGYNKNSYIKDTHEHQDKFDEFLQQLAKYYQEEDRTVEKSSNKEDLSGQSLELKSKHSRARLHYKKFIHSKDVSKYSSKDLANIFGKKKLTNKTEVNVKENNIIYENQVIGTKENWGGIVTINSGSMTDYFAQKLPNQKKILLNNTIDYKATDSESKTEQYADFEFIQKTENTLSTHGIPKNSGEKNNHIFNNSCLKLNSSMETTLNAKDSSRRFSRKKKKQVIDPTNSIIHSSWNKKARMTKKELKRLFYSNLIADFPGSNIQEIKGYGVDEDV